MLHGWLALMSYFWCRWEGTGEGVELPLKEAIRDFVKCAARLVSIMLDIAPRIA